jgi:RNA polymerase sigma factor (sigma-70 family)
MAGSSLGSAIRQLERLFDAGTVSGLDDAQLLERFVDRHDEIAFAAIVERHGPIVLGVCRSILKNAAEVEDAFQATFLVLIRKAGSIRGQDALGGWLHRVAYRIAVQAGIEIDRRRMLERKAGEFAARKYEINRFPDDLRAILHEEIDRLPERSRMPLVLCDLDGLDHAEASRRLGWTEGEFRGRLYRARAKLRDRLTKRGLGLSLVVLTEALAKESSAAVPRAWVNGLAKAAVAISTGKVVATGAISATAARLAQATLASLFAAQFKAIATTSVLILAMAMMGSHLIPAGSVRAGDKGTTAPAPKPAPPARAQVAAPAKTPKPKQSDEETVAVRGRVLDPDGKPLAGAKLYSYVAYTRDSDFPEKSIPPQTTSDKNGRFELQISAGNFLPAPTQIVYGKTTVAALADGFGPAWVSFSTAAEGKDLTLKLVKDDVPIEGRILDLEGKPVGGVAVSVVGIEVYPGDDLTHWEAAMAESKSFPDFFQAIEPRLKSLPDSLELLRWGKLLTATSDATGKFRLTGIGRERIASLWIEGPTIVASFATIHARTRPGATYRIAHNPDDPAYGQSIFYGSTFDYAAAPTRPIVGTVRDKDTGKPLAGISIRSDHFAGNIIHRLDFVRTTTDERGEYRLVGMPGGSENGIVVIPPPNLPYLGSNAEVRGTTGTEPVRVDFGLTRGVMIRGRVFDKVTGKPVLARVDYHAFDDNPHYRAAPRIFHRGFDGLMTRQDGSFELVGLPGHGLVSARAVKDEFLVGRGTETIAAKRDNNGWYRTGPGPCQPEFNHMIVEINPADDAKALTCNLALDPGRSLSGRVEGPDGKPLKGVTASNLGPHTASPNSVILPSPEFTALALDPKKPRPIFFRHEEKNLGAFVMVQGDEKEPLVVRLKPAATIAGRLLDADGQPLTSIQIQGNHPTGLFGSPWIFSDFPRPTIEASGKFRFEGIIPGIAYDVKVIRGHKILGNIATNYSFKSGEIKDMGDVVVKPEKSQ